MVEQVECPVCEAEFDVDGGPPEPQVECPACHHRFRLVNNVTTPTTAMQRPAPTGSDLTRRRPQLATPRPEGTLGLPKRRRDSTGEFTDESAATPPPAPVAARAPTPPSLVQVRQRYQRRHRHQTMMTIVSAIVLGGLIVGLTTFLFYRLGAQRSDAVAEQETVAENEGADEAVGNTQVSAPETVAVSSADRPPAKPKTIRLKDLPRQSFEFLSRDEADAVWELAQPRVVELTIYHAAGKRHAVGMLIDSRGWVLTSYRAIAGASRIEIRAAAKRIDNVNSDQRLFDEVLGLVASDPEHDMALLAVNRRFVVSFGQLPITASSRLVSGQYLVQAAPPSKDNPYARVEVEVSGRKATDQLDSLGQGKARSLSLPVDGIEWIVVERQANPLPGTPVFTDEAQLVGMVAFANGEFAYAVPASHAESLAASIDDPNVQPFPIRDDASPVESPTTIGESHPMRDVTVRMNQSGEACEAFGWIPNTEDQYLEVQKFAARTTEALRFTLDNRDNEAESDQVQTIRNQIDQWRASISESIGNPSADQQQRILNMNQLAADTLDRRELTGDERWVPFFGRVFAAGIVSPDPESMFLAVGGDRAFVKVPFEATGETMLPDSRWLFFVKRQPSLRKTRHQYSGLKFEASTGQLQFAIGPLEN